MQETTFSRARDGRRYQDEARALRNELTYPGIVGLMILFGWCGSVAAMTLAAGDQINWPVAGGFAVLFVLGLVSWLLSVSGRISIANALVAWGNLAIALGLLAVKQNIAFAAWVAIACLTVILVLGEWAGWVAAAASIASAILIGVLTNDLSLTLIVAASVITLTWLGRNVVGKLMQTMRWMTDGYEVTRQQAAELRDQKAELAAALKSLSQSSFSIARANEQLQSALKTAEDARRSKQEFAANISHELRAPLNLIIGFSDVLLNAPSAYGLQRVPAPVLSDVRVIYDSAQHLLKLVDDILDLSQLDVNYMTIAREPVAIEGFIRASVADFTRLTQLRGLTLTLDIAPDLPEVYADRTRIRQVLFNLLNNALRFTDEGGITIRATTDDKPVVEPILSPELVEGPKGPSSVVISVEDTGIGIAQKDLPRIFEPFTQADGSTRRKHGGTGLGLTISKRFVELHGGEMWVESTVGSGSTFFFSMPILPASMLGSEAITPRLGARHEIGSLAVVEGSPLLSRILEHHLAGMRVSRVNSLEQLAESATQSDSIDVEAVVINAPLCADWQPGAWPDALSRTPIFHCFIPNVFETMWPSNAPHQEGDAPRRFLVKPVTRDQLYPVLKEMLMHARGDDDDAPTRPARLLVVEDDDETLMLIGRMLRAVPPDFRAGFDAVLPVECRSGEQAIELLQADDIVFDGVLLDLGLGNVSGFDVLLEIERLERTRALPVCIVSGQALQARGEPLLTPYIAMTKREGLSTSELTQSLAALLQVALPGVEVQLR